MPRNLGPKHIRVVTSFTADSDHQLEETTGNVITGVYGNKAFPSPPVDAVTLKTALTAFTVAIAATAQGGVHATNEKNKKRHDLIGPLAPARDLRSGQLQQRSRHADFQRFPGGQQHARADAVTESGHQEHRQ